MVIHQPFSQLIVEKMRRLNSRDLNLMAKVARDKKKVAIHRNAIIRGEQSTKVLKAAMKKVWDKLIFAAISKNQFVTVSNMSDEELEAIRAKFEFSIVRLESESRARWKIDLEATKEIYDFDEFLFNIPSKSQYLQDFKVLLFAWAVSERGEGFMDLIEQQIKSTASKGKTHQKFSVRPMKKAWGEQNGNGIMNLSTFGKTFANRRSIFSHNYYCGHECIALEGPDPETFKLIMTKLGCRCEVTPNKNSFSVTVAWS